MDYAQNVGVGFDAITPYLLNLTGSEFMNIGYWEKTTPSIDAAQTKLAELFGDFSELKPALEVLDVGCGTGAQDWLYLQRFDCRHILGVNISQTQIEMAQLNIQKYPHWSDRIQFQVGDALKLKARQKNCFDRVLALECTQYFDKALFLAGSHHVLKPRAYLCTCEFIQQCEEIDIDKIMGEMPRELPGYFAGILLNQKKLVAENFKQFLQLKKINVIYPSYLKMFEEQNFTLEATQDISEYTLGFYPKIQEKINLALSKNPNPNEASFLINFLATQYLLFQLFSQRMFGFHFIRAQKLP